MRIAKFFLALIAMIALSSYLSSVSMCLVALTVSAQIASQHGLADTLVRVFYSVPLVGTMIAAPICALLSIVLGVAVLFADRFKVLTSQRARVLASSFVCALPGLAFGRIAGSSACSVAMHGPNLNCDLGMWVGILSFAVTGALAGMIFTLVYKLSPKN